jgi:hypothetical protein
MSTIKDTILSFQGLENIPDAFIGRVLDLRGLKGEDDYTADKDKQVCLAAADCYANMVNSPDWTENKLSQTYPRAFFRRTAKELYIQNGESDKATMLDVTCPKGKSGERW